LFLATSLQAYAWPMQAKYERQGDCGAEVLAANTLEIGCSELVRVRLFNKG